MAQTHDSKGKSSKAARHKISTAVDATEGEAANLNDESPEVGPNLRALRSELGLSLEELAQLSGVSRAMLGQIELGQSVPTIKTLWRIAKALDLPFSALLSSPRSKSKAQLLRRGDAKVLASAGGKFSSRALFPFGLPRRVEFYELTLKKGGCEVADAHALGTTENLVVAKGKVEISVGDANYELNPGDTLLFDADRPHSYRNVGTSDAQMFLVMTYKQPVD